MFTYPVFNTNASEYGILTLHDTFTGTEGIALHARSPDTLDNGETWEEAGSFLKVGNDADYGANVCYTSGEVRYGFIELGSSDCVVLSKMKPGTSNYGMGICSHGRDNSNYVMGGIYNSATVDPRIYIQSEVSGSVVSVNSTTLTGIGPLSSTAFFDSVLISDGSDYTFEITIGTTTYQVTGNTAVLPAETKVGLYIGQTVQKHADFQAYL